MPSTTSKLGFHSTRLFNGDDPIFCQLFPLASEMYSPTFQNEKTQQLLEQSLPLLDTGIALFFKASTAVATAVSIRRMPIGLATCSDVLIPSRTIIVRGQDRCGRCTVTCDIIGLEAASGSNLAPLFSKWSSNSNFFCDGHPIICDQG